jgi:hypothetical protein
MRVLWKILLVLAGLTVLVSLPLSTAGAQFTAAGSTGAVDEADRNIYEVEGQQVVIKSSAPTPSGVIMRYNVVDLPSLSGNRVLLTARYRDSGTSERVRVNLQRHNIFNGVTTTIASFDSNNFPQANGSQVQSVSSGCPHVFDFVNHTYYLEATLNKASGTGFALPLLSEMKLEGTVC